MHLLYSLKAMLDFLLSVPGNGIGLFYVILRTDWFQFLVFTQSRDTRQKRPWLAMASSMFTSLKADELQEVLRRKGISVSKGKCENLLKLCEAVAKLNLPDDPDMCSKIPSSIHEILSEFSIENPYNLQGLSADLTNLPIFFLFDVFSYLLYKTTNYDQRRLKAYKSCEDFRFFLWVC